MTPQTVLPDGRVELTERTRIESSPLYNEDLAPVPIARRTWTTYNYAALWISMAHCIPTYMLASGLIASGMNWWQALLTVALGNTIVLIPILLNSHPGTKYGIPFPVFARAAYGTIGSNLPALMRALVACGWFGIQAWIGGEALNTFFANIVPGWNALLGPGVAGHSTTEWISFGLFWGLNVFIIYRGMDLLRHVENWAAPFVLLMTGALLGWAVWRAHGFGPLLSEPGRFNSGAEFFKAFVPSLTAMIGFWATLSLNMPDFTRFGRSQREQVVGQVVALPTTMFVFAAMGVLITSATSIIYGELIWDPIKLIGRFQDPFVIAISMFTAVVATLAVNIAANVVSPANDFANAFPRAISFKTGGLITGILGILIQPWRLLADPSGYIFTWLLGYSGGLGSIAGVLIADYWFVRNTHLELADLYLPAGAYRYVGGWNVSAIVATIAGCAVAWAGLVVPALRPLYDYAWFVGFGVSFALHLALSKRQRVTAVAPLLVLVFLGSATLVPSASAPALAAASQDTEWPQHGGTNNIRYSPLTQVDKSNVAKLEVAWTYDSGDAFKGSEMQSNPVVVGGVLYATTPTLKVVAVDARTGREIWKFDPSNGAPAGARFRHRGVVVHGDRVFVTYRNWLYALHAASGYPIASFGTDGRVDLREGLGRPAEKLTVTASTPGVIFEDLLIMGSTVPETLPSAPGDIRAFDVNTGRIRWSFHTIPHPGERGYETWPEGAWQIAGGANAWAGVTVDPQRAMVFAATGSSSFDFYGANRKGDNLFADCVLALDARSGKYVWHFQGLKHDVWDLDFPAAPHLVTVTRDGRKMDAVAQITKTGFVFVLDRDTGKPLFPIEYRTVPGSRIDGEALSRTQPVPVRPPAFARSGPTEAMLTRRTPEAHAAVLAQFRALKSGLFEPPSTEGTIIFPGVDGGGEWGGAAFDPASALLFVNANEMPWIVRLIPNDDTSLYNAKCAACHRTDRQGTAAAPSLIDIGARKSREQLIDVIRHGTGRMPGYPDLGAKNTSDLVEFLVTGKDRGSDPGLKNDPTYVKYRSDGETLWRDPDGYPPLTPPWGTLNAIDLNAGTIRWRIPFGEYPELVAKGVRNTGSDNYGGPVVTASGLLFIGATNFDRKFHAYDKLTGKLLWETTLPAAGNATPAIYSIGGREFIVIACGGGKNGAPSGSTIVAFALPVPAVPGVPGSGL